MKDVILVVNAGSSSLKIAVYELNSKIISTLIYRILLEFQGEKLVFQLNGQKVNIPIISKESNAINRMIEVFSVWWEEQEGLNLIATGHRIVHGGALFSQPVIVTELIKQQIQALIPLAPLHQPYNFHALNLFQQEYPEKIHVACFDTAFHTTQPDIAKAYGLPKKYFDEKVYRYGFHGLSYQWVSRHFQEITGQDLPKRTIIAHLGNGCSMCALENGVSKATTMGFSVIEGLLMGSRCGSIDPGVLLYLLTHEKMSVEELTTLLYRKSGLLGISGESSDVRTLLASSSGEAKFAIDLFVYRAQLEIGRLTAAIGGLDALIFTAGIGQNSAIIRRQIAEKLEWLGIKLDFQKNNNNEYYISSDDSIVKVFAIPTNEERVIAEDIVKLL